MKGVYWGLISLTYVNMMVTVIWVIFLVYSYLSRFTQTTNKQSISMAKPNICSACVTKSDTSMRGTCYTSTECTNRGGTADGKCASGKRARFLLIKIIKLVAVGLLS